MYLFQVLYYLLKQSLTSVAFYERVFKNYSGWGLKYILSLTLFAAVIAGSILTTKLINISYNLNPANRSNSFMAQNFAHITKQLPTIEYDGHNIHANSTEPIKIADLNQNLVLIIDADNKLLPREQNKALLILRKNDFILNINQLTSAEKYQLQLELGKLLGSTPLVIDASNAGNYLARFFQVNVWLVLLITVPVMAIFATITTITDHLMLIGILWVVSRFSKTNLTLQDIVRGVLFASGMNSLLLPIIASSWPSLTLLLWPLQMLTVTLMLLGLRNVLFKQPKKPGFF